MRPVPKMTWDAATYFKQLTLTNKLAQDNHFFYCDISGLGSMEEVISNMKNMTAFVAVNNTEGGTTFLDNAPFATRSKGLFFGMRHLQNNMPARQECIDIMSEIYRQFNSRMLRDEETILDERTKFNRQQRLQVIDRYLNTEWTILFAEIGTQTYFDMCYNADDWLTPNSNESNA